MQLVCQLCPSGTIPGPTPPHPHPRPHLAFEPHWPPLLPVTAPLLQLDPGNSKYGDYLQSFFDQYLSLEGEIKHTKCGLAIPYHWGALTHGPNVGEPAAGAPHA